MAESEMLSRKTRMKTSRPSHHTPYPESSAVLILSLFLTHHTHPILTPTPYPTLPCPTLPSGNPRGGFVSTSPTMPRTSSPPTESPPRSHTLATSHPYAQHNGSNSGSGFNASSIPTVPDECVCPNCLPNIVRGPPRAFSCEECKAAFASDVSRVANRYGQTGSAKSPRCCAICSRATGRCFLCRGPLSQSTVFVPAAKRGL